MMTYQPKLPGALFGWLLLCCWNNGYSVYGWSSSPSFLQQHQQQQHQQQQQDSSCHFQHEYATTSLPERRTFLQNMGVKASLGVFAAAAVGRPLWTPLPAFAAEPQVFRREQDSFAYSIALPPSFKETQKPVKTHLDEVNLVSEEVKGYQYGITVDPVRISILKDFGTPEEVAARVVTAEVNRDGVFEVTLVNDPYESKDGAYVLEYTSEGKRGNKHYFNKIFIAKNRLYVLTAQVKEADFETQKEQLRKDVATFQLL